MICPQCGHNYSGCRINPTEWRVLRLLGEGVKPRLIAKRMNVANSTVKQSITRMGHKFGLDRNQHRHVAVTLAVWFNSPMFLEGLSALDLLPNPEAK